MSLVFNKAAGLRHATLLKKGLWHRSFRVNFVKFLRTPFSRNSSWRLFQVLVRSGSGSCVIPFVIQSLNDIAGWKRKWCWRVLHPESPIPAPTTSRPLSVSTSISSLLIFCWVNNIRSANTVLKACFSNTSHKFRIKTVPLVSSRYDG